LGSTICAVALSVVSVIIHAPPIARQVAPAINPCVVAPSPASPIAKTTIAKAIVWSSPQRRCSQCSDRAAATAPTPSKVTSMP
jgi:hypothetical protein